MRNKQHPCAIALQNIYKTVKRPHPLGVAASCRNKANVSTHLCFSPENGVCLRKAPACAFYRNPWAQSCLLHDSARLARIPAANVDDRRPALALFSYKDVRDEMMDPKQKRSTDYFVAQKVGHLGDNTTKVGIRETLTLTLTLTPTLPLTSLLASTLALPRSSAPNAEVAGKP